MQLKSKPKHIILFPPLSLLVPRQALNPRDYIYYNTCLNQIQAVSYGSKITKISAWHILLLAIYQCKTQGLLSHNTLSKMALIITIKGRCTALYSYERKCKEMPKIFTVAGGDMRFSSLAAQLADEFTVYAAGFDPGIIKNHSVTLYNDITKDLPEADCLVLPLPVSNDGISLNTPLYEGTISLEHLLKAVKKNGTVFGGKISEDIRSIFEAAGFKVFDYLEREEMAVQNALATAEGALQIALEKQPCTISGQNILILGMGRIAKSLIRILSGFGCSVTIAARKYSDLAWAEVYGCKALHISELFNSDAPSKSDIIFNTVPSMILNKTLLKKCSVSCLMIDLASKPGGIDISAAEELGLRAVRALSLPGKTAPVSSGRIIGNTIKNILNETE